jgi:hypothetical protein
MRDPRSSLTFTQTIASLAGHSDDEMAEPWTWPGHTGGPLQVRDALWRCVETEQASLAIDLPPSTEAESILTMAQGAWGDLRGLIVGLPDETLDLTVGPGDWSVRQILSHVLLIERRYRVQSLYAATRRDHDPTRTQTPEALGPGETDGGAAAWIERIDAERALTDTDLAWVGPNELGRPTEWAGYSVDLRFRLHRFAAHLAEHAIHAEKVILSKGIGPSEANQIVRRLSALRGAHERRAVGDTLRSLDGEHAALAASISMAG